ncbi:MAG: cohesin domain-containing protein [Planctomycetota bacterium]
MRSRHRPLRYESLETRDLLTTVQIADAIVGHPTSRVNVPVTIDDATGMRAAEIRIAYDTKQLEVQPKDITAGSVWAGKALAMSNIDEQAGVIVAFVFALESVAGGAGSVIDVSFTVRSDSDARVAKVDLAEVHLNEGQIVLAKEPISGADATDGVIRIKRDAISNRDLPVPRDRTQVCAVDWQAGTPPIRSQPAPHIAALEPLRLTPTDKSAWLRRGSKFIGPLPDAVFATTDQWLIGR